MNITATHTVEFWELEPDSRNPSNVMMFQRWRPATGAIARGLGPELLDASGSLANLYQKLVTDATYKPARGLSALQSVTARLAFISNVPVPLALAKADERRSNLPIRDASYPLPTIDPPPQKERTFGERKGSAAELFPVLLSKGADVDDVWSGAAYDSVVGAAQETIFWDSVGANLDGSTAGWFGVATYVVHQFINGVWRGNQFVSGGWRQIVRAELAPGEAFRATAVGVPAVYQGSISGRRVGYSESWRLSFPQLVSAEPYPGRHLLGSPPVGHWPASGQVVGGVKFGIKSNTPSFPLLVDNGFGNDIQGLTHNRDSWILSRTEWSSAWDYIVSLGDSDPQYGVIGTVGPGQSLNRAGQPNRNQFREPGGWRDQGFNHFGEIVYDDVSGDVFVGMTGTVVEQIPRPSDDGAFDGTFQYSSHDVAGIGVFHVRDGQYGGAALIPRGGGLITLNPKTREFYDISQGSMKSFSEGQLRSAIASGQSPPLKEIKFVNQISDANGGLNGAKVSRNGKLWTCAISGDATTKGEESSILATDVHYIYIWGIDPYSGIIQTKASINVSNTAAFGHLTSWRIGDQRLVDATTSLAGWDSSSIEAEGLDITYPSDALPSGVAGTIHVQFLVNYKSSNDKWALVNLGVSDLARV